jgi:hypothetical protein
MARSEVHPLPPALARELATYIRAIVREELRGAVQGGEADPWVDHRRWPCASRRAACALARSGALDGVRRVGQGRGALYLVRRSVLDAWIEAQHATAAEPPPEDAYEREMAKRNLRPGCAPANDAAQSRRRR